jgi:hypothetical protein
MGIKPKNHVNDQKRLIRRLEEKHRYEKEQRDKPVGR